MKGKYLVITSLVIVLVLLVGFTQDYYYKINRSFDIIGAIFREVSSNYVLDVDPEILARGAIDGMLATLDPYTEYYDAKDEEDFQALTKGTYTGFGLSLSTIDNKMTVTQVRDGYPAGLAGIRIGDVIYKIDDIEVMNKEYDEIKDHIKGSDGSKSTFHIIRDGLNDTLIFKISRKQILLDNISFYDLLDSSIGYIRIDRFTPTVANDFRIALNDLKKGNLLKSLIIDLRDNPGGLLEPAVQICEMFLPFGSVVVSTIGRNNEEVYSFKSNINPTDPDLPLVIMINEGSASASEIIAGAMQDLDRAVIVGERSYGKGLVQSVLQLPYNANLKITTAKYFIPSGRCIQRIKFAEKYNKNAPVQDAPDTNTYYTQNKRKVYESTGILPDTSTEKQYSSEIVGDLTKKWMFFKFSNYYTGRLKEIPSNFSADNKIFELFKNWLKKNNYTFESEAMTITNRLSELSKELKTTGEFSKSLSKIKNEIEKYNEFQINKSKDEILEFIDFDIRRRFYSERQTIAYLLNSDGELKLAKSVTKQDIYKNILAKKN